MAKYGKLLGTNCWVLLFAPSSVGEICGKCPGRSHKHTLWTIFHGSIRLLKQASRLFFPSGAVLV